MTKIRAAITSVGKYLPEDRMTNHDLERLVDTNDEWIVSRTGIRERRILRDPGKGSAFMATEAARQCLEKRGVRPDEVDLILLATITPDHPFPATACLVQDRLGATNAWAYDLSAACSGFLFGLATGAQFIETGKHKKVLVIGVDKMSSILDYTDRNTCIIFGDGAGAVLLEPDDTGVGLVDSREYTDGSGIAHLWIKSGGSLHPASHETVAAREHFVYQDGKSVFKRAVVGMAEVAAEVMERNGLTGEDVTWLVPHQANLRIISATAERMGVPMDKVMLNIERYGNTTGATLPLCLADYEAQLRRGDTIVFAAFGGGFTWASAYVRWAYDGTARPDPAG